MEGATTIFPLFNIETMNEDDVSGEIVRPFCRALGYSQGNPEANLRSQVSLQYDKVFLGHKDAKKDPVLRGRPDFVCEVISYARWVIESKSPAIDLSTDDSYQAHTYATHPEIAAEFYVLTNGRILKIYRVGQPDKPIWEISIGEIDSHLPALKGFLGPAAMRKRAALVIDKGKPLIPGIGSFAEIVGGSLVYTRNVSTLPGVEKMDGLVNTITGNRVYRGDDGLIYGEASVRSAFAAMDAVFEAFKFYPLRFSTADEYLSADIERPTILQGLLNVRMPAGTTFPKTIFSPGGVLPIDVKVDAYLEVVGFVESQKMRGTFAMDCEYELDNRLFPMIPPTASLTSEGTFEIHVK